MQYNYSRLLGLMREKGYTQAETAKRIGICTERLSAKLNNKSLFKQSEIARLCDLLGIGSEEIGGYFFNH